MGHTEAVVTGILVGHNAVRYVKGLPLKTIPTSLAIGDAITHVREQMETEEGMGMKFTFSGAQYFKRMQALGLYLTDPAEVQKRVAEAGMTDFFGKPVQ